MISKFLNSFRMAVTPLSPIHDGSGEDYEPTNYVIDEKRGFLYFFDPSEAPLTSSERGALRAAVNTVSCTSINEFYHKKVELFRPWARTILPIGAQGKALYRKMLAPTGNQKATQFNIARCMYEFSGDTFVPYLPGSSIKGAIVMALIDRINQGRRVKDGKEGDLALVKNILGGDMDKSPMRFVRVGDCHGLNPRSRIFTARRYFKQDAKLDSIESTFEAVSPAQYRAFEGEITLAPGQNLLNLPHVYRSTEEICRDIHAYAMARWSEEVEIYQKLSPEWTEEVQQLLKSMEPVFASGRAALVRLGKNAGAEHKTLHAENSPQIQIRHKDGSKETLTKSTTLWGIHPSETPFSGMPFGWAIIEMAYTDDCRPLENWCERTTARLRQEDAGKSVADEWDFVLGERQALILKRDELRAQALAEARQRAEKEAEEQNKAAALAAMSPVHREISILCTQLKEAPGNVSPGTELFKKVQAYLEAALAWTSAEDKLKLATDIQPLMKKKDMFQGKAAKVFKAQLRQLRGEA